MSEKDAAGSFIQKVAKEFREKANLPCLGYASVEEALAEKFHISETLLRQLNPKMAFDTAGTVKWCQRAAEALPRKIAPIVVARQQVRAYDKDDCIVAIYPATVGSTERPTLAGDLKVIAVAENQPITMTLH